MSAVYFGLTVVTAPTGLPLTDDELIRSARLITADAMLDELKAKAYYAVEHIEGLTNRTAMQTQYNLSVSRFPVFRGQALGRLSLANGPLRLPRSPVISVDSIDYIDVNGDEQSMEEGTWQLRKNIEPAVVAPARLQFWPLTDPWSIDGVNIKFTAGYVNAGAVPARYKEAVKFLANYRFFNRESDDSGELPASLGMLINGLSVKWLE